jgi:hypothetical protein
MRQNCDNNEPLEEDHSRHVFYVPEALDPSTGASLKPELCLRDLRLQWNERYERFSLEEAGFLEQYNTFLQGLADERIRYVNRWISTNSSKFKEKIAATGLVHRFEGLTKELKAAVMLCGIMCSSCGLRCLRQKYHAAKEHDCMTDHRCHRPCDITEQHVEDFPPECDLP